MKLFNKFQQIHFYYDRTVKSHAFRADVELTEPINEAVLKDALKKTLEVFPTVASRPFITGDKRNMGMIPNNAEPLISHDDAPVALGTDESNGYLFRLTVSGNIIRFNCFHALMDGRATILFMTQLLCFYLKGVGHDIGDAGIVYTGADLSDPKVTAPFEALLTEHGITHGTIDPDAPPQENVFHDAREDELYERKNFILSRYAVPFSQIKECTHALGTTPLVLFYILLAQAMRETSDVGSKYLQCGFAVDLRGRFGSRSQEEYSSTASFYYPPDMADLPLSQQIAAASASLEKLMSGDNLLYTVKDYVEQYDILEPYMDLTRQEELLQPRLTEKGRINSTSFFISNIGAVRFPEDMAPYIKDFQTFSTPAKYDPNFVMHTYNNTFYINYFHNSTDETHVNRFIEKLVEHGVNVEKLFTRSVRLDYLGKIPVEEPALV